MHPFNTFYLAAFELMDLKQIAMLIFIAIFLLVIIRLLLVRSGESDHAAHLPLEDGDISNASDDKTVETTSE